MYASICLFNHVPQLAGLPSSPPSSHSSAANINGNIFPSDGNGRMPLKPLGIDVPRRKKVGTGGTKIAVIVLSSVTAFAVCIGVLWILLLKCGWCICKPQSNPHVPIPSQRKLSGLYHIKNPSFSFLSFSANYFLFLFHHLYFSELFFLESGCTVKKSKILLGSF